MLKLICLFGIVIALITTTCPACYDNPVAENFILDCISFNLDNLTCTWYGKNKTFLENTKWQLHYLRNGLWKSFPQDNLTANSYAFKPNLDGYPTTARKLCFSLTANDTTTDNFVFDHYKIVKLNPPRDIIPIIGSKTIQLNWKSPLTEIPNNKSDVFVTYRISYISKWSERVKFETNDTNYIIKDLIPYTNYSVIILAKLQFKSYLNKWSNPIMLTKLTKEEIPEKWQALTSESYQKLTENKIILYFKTLNFYQQNGKDFTYKIFDVNSGIEPIKTTKSYVEIPINTIKSYIFQVSAINNIGETTSNQSLYISNISQEIPRPYINDIINYENGTYLISWNSTNTSLDYTIFCCKTENKKLDEEKKYIHCDNSGLKWTDNVQCRTNLCQQLVTINETNQYSFSVAAKLGDSSSGLVWSTCTIPISRDSIPVLKPQIENTGFTWAEISWNIPCKERISTIAAFQFYYQNLNSTSDEENKTLPSFGQSREEYKLENLKNNTTYSFQMSVVLSSGKEGNRSAISVLQTRPIIGSVSEYSSQLSAIIISISVVIALFGLTALGFLIHKKYLKDKIKIIRGFFDYIPQGIVNANIPHQAEYNPVRRKSSTCFTIQVPKNQLKLTSSIDSNSSGFISDSLESVFTPISCDHHCSNNYSKSEEENINRYEQEKDTDSGYVQAVNLNSNTASTSNGYVQAAGLLSTTSNRNSHNDYVQAVSLNLNHNNNASISNGYVQAANLLTTNSNGNNNNGYVQAANLLTTNSNGNNNNGYVQATSLDQTVNNTFVI